MVKPNEDGSNVPDELKYMGKEKIEGKELENWLNNAKREYESKHGKVSDDGKGHKGKDYKKIDHDRGKFDGRASKVIGVDSDIKDQRFEKNIKEGYKKFGCKFLQSRKSLNEDKLTNLLNTKRNIREQKTLSKKISFIESAIRHTKCGTILREQKEDTLNNRNEYRRLRKLIYENMNWESVRRNNNRRLRK